MIIITKILYITLVFPQQRVLKTIETLKKAGHDVDVMTFKIDEGKNEIFNHTFTSDNCFVLNSRKIFRFLPLKSIIYYKKIIEIIKNNNYSKVIVRDIFLFDIASFIKRRYKIDYILDIADNYPEVFKSNIKFGKMNKLVYSFYNYMEKKAVKKAESIFTVTYNSKDLILRKHQLNNKNILVLANYPMRNDVPDQQLNVGNTKERLVYIGKVDEVVRDFSTLFQIINEMNLKIDIYSSDSKLISKLITNNNVSDNVRNFPPVRRSELSCVLNQYLAGVIPHKLIPGTDFTIPNKLYDYIHGKIPVISTPNNALKLEIENLNIGLTYNNSVEFYNAYCSIKNDRTVYEKNLAMASKKCIWEKQEHKIMEAIN